MYVGWEERRSGKAQTGEIIILREREKTGDPERMNIYIYSTNKRKMKEKKRRGPPKEDQEVDSKPTPFRRVRRTRRLYIHTP